MPAAKYVHSSISSISLHVKIRGKLGNEKKRQLENGHYICIKKIRYISTRVVSFDKKFQRFMNQHLSTRCNHLAQNFT